MTSPATRRLVVIGAGPIGLEAALGAVERGFDVTVLEQGDIGDALRRIGPTRFFSPLGMNLSPRARAVLGGALDLEALLTGPEMVERVLDPLARSPSLRGRIRTRTRVLAVGRAGMGRVDLPGHPLRASRPFRLLTDGADGERWLECDAVLDASGVYGQPLAVGSGGIPAPGERAAEARIVRDLGALHRRRGEFLGRRVMLVGHGHSAAHAIDFLDEVAGAATGTSLVWVTRSRHRNPCVDVADDPLPERARVVLRANALAAAPPPHLTVERGAQVEAISVADGALRIALSGGRAHVVDAIVALTGYRPDRSFLDGLQLELSPVSEGADRLHRAISSVTDCLSVPRVAASDLASGEPGFHLVGAKSYGRSRTFLLRTGLEQLETVLAGL